MSSLLETRCQACEGGLPLLTPTEISQLLGECPKWQQIDNRIERVFHFKGYGKTMAFANAVAWIAHQEGHHPDLYITFNSCTVTLTTHAMGGLTKNDFIFAAKVNNL